MRLISLLFATAAALSMVVAPAFADPANPAAKLSLTNTGSNAGAAPSAGPSNDVRAGARTKRSSKFVFSAPLVLLGVAATAGVVAGAVAMSSSDSNASGSGVGSSGGSTPASP